MNLQPQSRKSIKKQVALEIKKTLLSQRKANGKVKNVESYITQLLYTHDCVIVPDLGGFFTVRTDAKHDANTHRFKAPGKRPAFNPALQHNDGLLIGNIAREADCSYEEAKEHVNTFTRVVKSALSSGEGVSLSGLGTLTHNTDNKPVFTPDESVNYDTDTFALESFHAVPVEKEKDAPVTVATPAKPTVLESEKNTSKTHAPEQAPKKVKKEQKSYRLAAAAVALLIIAGGYLGWVISSTGLIQPNRDFEVADLNPFREKICDLYEPRKSVPLFLQSEWVNNENPLTLHKQYGKLELTYNEGFIPVKLPHKKSTSQTTAGRFHVIAGAFKSKHNAEAFIRRVNQKGFNGIILDRNNSLYRVSATQKSSRSEANKALREIRSSINKEAWVLTK